MNSKILPIGSVIELEDRNKYIIIGYETLSLKNLAYICAGYPAYYLTDMIPQNKVNEFKEKYGFYNTDINVSINKEYKVIFEGFKNKKYYDLVKIIEED